VKVLHVAETAKGGVRGYLEELVPHQLAIYGADSVRLVLPKDHVDGASPIPASAIRAIAADNNRLRRTLRLVAATLSELRHWQPDVVHLHSTFAGAALRPLLALLPGGPRVIYCAHGWAFDRAQEGPANGLIAAVERLLARWTDAIVCVSAHDRQSALAVGIAAERLIHINNGIADLPGQPETARDPADAWPADRVRILFVGRLDRQKGADILCQALEQLRHTHYAVVIGDSVVSNADAALRLPDNARGVGWIPRSDVEGFVRAAQVVVMPSRWEGLPLVALEAMRAGRAVVATRVGGLPEVVEHETTGLLVPPDDAPALVRALAVLDAARLESMGAAGRQRFERLFRADRMRDRTEALYRSLVPTSADPQRQALPEP
jgi:glycosyltransferase involved in cell wall biosynthesis